eukprot:9482318-Pyramimonas_sp.AAC.1
MEASQQSMGVVDTMRGKQLALDGLRDLPPISLAEAVEAMRLLSTSAFNVADRAAISLAVQAKVVRAGGPGGRGGSGGLDGSGGGRDGRAQGQTCLHLQRYFTDSLWAIILDPGTQWESAFMHIQERLGELGLVNPCEKTKILLWCIWVVARTPPGSMPVYDPVNALAKKHDIGAAMARYRKRGKLDHHGQVTQYPPTPAEFLASYPSLYEVAYPHGQLPAIVPINELVVENLRSQLACRGTHGSIAGSLRAPLMRQPTYRAPCMGAHLHRQLTAAPHDDPLGIGMVIYDRPQPANQQGYGHPAFQRPQPAPTAPLGAVPLTAPLAGPPPLGSPRADSPPTGAAADAVSLTDSPGPRQGKSQQQG